MSIGGSFSGISFGGVASGMDTESIVSRLIQLEAIPLQRMQQQQQSLSTRMGALQQLRNRVVSLATAAGALNSASAFAAIGASSSDTAGATVSADAGAAAGIYQPAVSKLAQANKISSGAQAGTETELNLSGKFVVNGKTVTVETTDSLKTIAQKVNALNVGVTASLIDGGTNNAYLTFTSSSTGAAGKIQIANMSGTVLEDLALTTGGASTIREAISGGATSFGFASATTSIAQTLGTSGLGTKSFQINGQTINVDLDNANLSGVAAAINLSGSGATATVRTVTTDGKTTYKLDITGLTSFDDSQNVLGSLGVVQQAFKGQLTAAQDAEFTLDGVAMTSAKNSVTSVIPGVTLTLHKANATTPEKSTITLTQDNAAIKKKIVEFKDAFNAMVDFVKQNSSFDKTTFASGVLFGDGTSRQIEASASSVIFNTVSGLTSQFSNLTQLGFGFDSDGKLTLDEAGLDSALASSATDVSAVFRQLGNTTVQGLTYVSALDKTKAGSYNVNITSLATKGAYTGEVAQTVETSLAETLTFTGSLFGSTPYELDIAAGSSQADIVSKINNDTKLKDLVVASVEGGKLKIESKKFGTIGNFTVKSSLEADVDNSGIGKFFSGTTVTGADIAGTINGKAATGNGQFLTSSEGDSEGLQVLYTGNSVGSLGSMTYTKGISAQMTTMLNTFTDTVNGLLTASDKSLQDQIDTIGQSMTALQERLGRRQLELRAKFTRMEQAISQLQAQSNGLSALR
ncbi:MAG TPA: flagellar filament capping protein FliD [Fimbriimonadaceae bacterium]|nr:flagellar filament capping protein FliD [Fimbriimonadaceae bacterium]